MRNVRAGGRADNGGCPQNLLRPLRSDLLVAQLSPLNPILLFLPCLGIATKDHLSSQTEILDFSRILNACHHKNINLLLGKV